ncbi:MoaD/ThiS family protein [Flavobacterium sp.]
MEVTVKYFGIIADITQKKEEVFLIDNDQNTLKNLELKIKIKYPKILDVNYSRAINKLFANCDTTLKDKDEVAFLPPFAGG